MLSLFRTEFNNFNNTEARMLDSIYHMTLKIHKNRTFAVKRQDFPSFTQRYNGRHYVTLRNL